MSLPTPSQGLMTSPQLHQQNPIHSSSRCAKVGYWTILFKNIIKGYGHVNTVRKVRQGRHTISVALDCGSTHSLAADPLTSNASPIFCTFGSVPLVTNPTPAKRRVASVGPSSHRRESGLLSAAAVSQDNIPAPPGVFIPYDKCLPRGSLFR